jgi:hypothetical protein
MKINPLAKFFMRIPGILGSGRSRYDTDHDGDASMKIARIIALSLLLFAMGAAATAAWSPSYAFPNNPCDPY